MSTLPGFFVRVRSRELRRVREWIQPGPDRRILDVGGGNGDVSAWIVGGSGAAVTVLEPRAARVASGERRHPELAFVAGRGERIPFPDGSFDRVLAMRSFHHMHGQAAFLQEARRVLVAGGRLIVEELDPSSPVGLLFQFLHLGRRHEHLEFLDSDSLRTQLAATGFLEIEVARYRRWYFVTATR